MREKLDRAIFTGTFVKLGGNLKEPSVDLLIENICDASGKETTNQLWFNMPKGFFALNLKGGERIEFHARIKENQKGHNKGHISKIRVLKEAMEPNSGPVS